MKRELHTDSVNTLLSRLSQEHELFYYQMISKPPDEIYHSCGIIRFYDSVWEYFQYKENLDKEYVEACLDEDNILAVLYDLYLKYEHLNAGLGTRSRSFLTKRLTFGSSAGMAAGKIYPCHGQNLKVFMMFCGCRIFGLLFYAKHIIKSTTQDQPYFLGFRSRVVLFYLGSEEAQRRWSIEIWICACIHEGTGKRWEQFREPGESIERCRG